MLKKTVLSCLIVTLFTVALPLISFAGTIWPVVSPDWLEQNLNDPNLVAVDIRKVEDYKAGHIPKAVNVFYGSWAIMKGGLRNELPPTDDLFDVLGSAGISADSSVVVVGKVDTMSDRADITRVAWTLKYLGLENLAILDGGYNRWINENRAKSTDTVKPMAKTYKGNINQNLFVNKDYVKGQLGKSVIVDARDPDFYQGAKKLDFVAKVGRIKGAVNLPSSGAYKTDGTLKIMAELGKLAETAVGKDTSKEIIIYCDSGKLATVWASVMTDILGYKNVKTYDGSAEEWMKDPQAPVEP